MMKQIMVAGIDPSLRNLGTVRALIDPITRRVEVVGMTLYTTESRDKKTVRKNSDDLRRARELRSGIDRACVNCSVAMVEVPVGSQSARASWGLGIAVGVLASCPVPMIEVTPTEVKLATVGSKTASKEDMILWAMERHPNAPWIRRKMKGKEVITNANEHLADALGTIYAGLHTETFQMVCAVRGAAEVAA
ncbi:hypothetical protein [Ectothiorhodospira shaposhnikovii]|uniref:hypothetical protein n=1 Tax=Ectothiorhodospira shaposhnikovii TaxID=1054 RepID=UPI001EE79E88|nr:hypothetical protein [Ectothiorhodospira shaposhnikovii]MCG5512790.1 hypothetical protein [Ectothiorhodospira shaposhnikovii]